VVEFGEACSNWACLSQIFEAAGGLLQLGIEAADAKPNQRCFHSVDDPTSSEICFWVTL